MPASHTWDIFCRVIDNHGDIGVCWRLAAALARRGQAVRLWVDDASALAWLAPEGAPGVGVQRWDDASKDLPDAIRPGDCVVEAFGCDPPPAFVARMAQRPVPPVWINLEYLSAEAFVERAHGLRSPQSGGPGAGLSKWFFYPGFSDRTGGLLQADQPDAATHADTPRWLARQGWAAQPGERSVLVFGYDNPALPALLQALATRPTLLRLMPGPPRQPLLAARWPDTLRLLPLPYVPQPDFDRLLAASDLNLVRGEDSFVRAQVVSDAPFLWQIYPQHDGAHAAKLEAFVARALAGADAALAGAVAAAFRACNGLAAWPEALGSLLDGPLWPRWQAWQRGWRAGLAAREDLADRLIAFAAERASTPTSTRQG